MVIGAGKGAAQLAAAFERLWDGPLEGVVVTRYGYGAPCRQIRVLEAVASCSRRRRAGGQRGAVRGRGGADGG